MGSGTLYNCAWDAVKLALAQREGVAHDAYLIAGAPRHDWSSGQRGSDLFESGGWETFDFMALYADEFTFWRGQVKARPEVLPAGLSFTPTHRVNFDLRDEPWSIRASRVAPVGHDLVAVDENGEPART